MELHELEVKIGVRPWAEIRPEPGSQFQNSDLIRQWLLIQGMPKKKLDNMTWDSLAKCYSIRNYFEVVAELRPKKLDWKKKKIADEMLEEETPYDFRHLLDDKKPFNPTPILPPPQFSQSTLPFPEENLKPIIEKILESTLSGMEKIKLEILKDIQSKQSSQQYDTIQAVSQKLNSGEIKLSFTDAAKKEIKDLVLKTVEANFPPQEVVVKFPEKGTSINIGHVHKEFPTLLNALSCKLHIILVGMASSSKTTSAKIAAEALDLPFYHMGAAASEFKFAGFQDGNGLYHTTPFREAFEKGGVILLDEYDGCIPAATMFIQAALANQTCHFPDKIIEAHEDFLCIAACNTYGRGSDRQYVGRNQQDAAAMDRFVVLDWDIDEDLEAQLYGDGRKHWDGKIQHSPEMFGDDPDYITLSPGDWVRRVQKIRHAISELGERHLVTMRASDYGSRLLQAGLSLPKVEEMCVWKGLNPSVVEKIKHHAKL